MAFVPSTQTHNCLSPTTIFLLPVSLYTSSPRQPQLLKGRISSPCLPCPPCLYTSRGYLRLALPYLASPRLPCLSSSRGNCWFVLIPLRLGEFPYLARSTFLGEFPYLARSIFLFPPSSSATHPSSRYTSSCCGPQDINLGGLSLPRHCIRATKASGSFGGKSSRSPAASLSPYFTLPTIQRTKSVFSAADC